MACMDEEPDLLTDVIWKLTDGKAPGYDNITAKELKATGSAWVGILHHLCNKIWENEEFPDDWGKAIITLTRKKYKLDCENQRGISLAMQGKS